MNKEILESKIEELKEVMNDVSIDMSADYDICTDDYLEDMISEYADSRVDIYNYDLLEWFREHWDMVEEAIDELGVVTDGGRVDIFGTIRQGQYLYYQNQLYEDRENIVYIMICRYIIDHIEDLQNLADIDEDGLDDLLEECGDDRAYYRVSDIVYNLENYGVSEDEEN